jgi:hypothetical protein
MTWLILSKSFSLGYPRPSRGSCGAEHLFTKRCCSIWSSSFGRGFWARLNLYNIFGILTAGCLCFVRNSLLETNGLTLEEIKEIYQNGGHLQKGRSAAPEELHGPVESRE